MRAICFIIAMLFISTAKAEDVGDDVDLGLLGRPCSRLANSPDIQHEARLIIVGAGMALGLASTNTSRVQLPGLRFGDDKHVVLGKVQSYCMHNPQMPVLIAIFQTLQGGAK